MVDWTIQKILKDIAYLTEELPQEALRKAIDNQAKITTELLRILEYARKNIRELLYMQEEDYVAHLYAFYLLAQFREQRAYPLIVDFFSIPGEATLTTTGNFVTEDLGRVLASVSGGDPSLMKQLIEDEKVNEWVRSAAIDGLLSLVIHDQLSREEVIDYFRGLYRGGLEREPSAVWDALISGSCDLYPEELFEDIRQAFEEDLIDSVFVPFREIEEALKRDKEDVLAKTQQDPHLAFVDDTIKEIEWWACFQSSPPKPSIAPAQKIGRNDPCPCGSGKKYKYCCGMYH
ncbi:MAG: DUF1186 domain-containing protein [Anaerolineae bacterium]|nr:DUF1186 domain-containing protein [Anaerolineae bacterium]